MGQKPVLSISLLASNRIDTIRQTLDSLKPIMEQIPSELILTDTSKNPEIHQILLEYTDQVIEFEWCNDFAKARNAGLALAKGEWFLYLDDDEWFVEIDELVKFFKSGEYRKYGCANYIQRNLFDHDYINYSDSWVSRMIRLDQDTTFKSKIHEYLYPQRGDIKFISSIVYHTGYLFATEEDNRKHFERNATLLFDMIEEEPENLRWKVQLAQEYRAVKEWDKLYKFCEECLEATNHRNNTNDNYDIGTFYAGAMEGLFSLKRYEEAIDIGRRALKDTRNSELCLAYIYLCFGTIYYRQGDWEHVEDNIYKYFRIRKRLNKNKQLLAEQQGALLVGEALDQTMVKRAYSILIGNGLKRKDTSLLKKHLKELEWDKKIVYAFDGIAGVLAEAYSKIPLEPIFVESAQLMWNNPTLRGELFVKVQEMEEQDGEGYRRALHVLAKLSGEYWYLWYAKILVADWDQKTENLQEYLEGFFRDVSDVFSVPDNVIEIAEKYKISVEELYLKTPFERWKENLSDYISKVSLNDVRITRARMQAMKTRENMRYSYLFARVAEAEVLYSVSEKEFDKKRQSLVDFAEKAEAFHREYYQAYIVDEYPELLPEYAQAALFIARALAMEVDEPKEALETLKLAVDVYPSIAEAVKSYMRAFGEEQKRKERAAREEMRQLQEKIKAEVYRCMEQKRYEAALQILAQLKQLKPNDLELAELSLRIRLAMLS